MNRLFRAGALALAFLSSCDYFKDDATPPGAAIAVADAGKHDASPPPLLDERLEKYFVEDRVEREGMVLGKAPEDLVVNDEKTEYVNSIFVEGSENALRAVEQTHGRIISKIGDTYELFIPARSVEERDTLRSRLEQQAIESFAHHILLFDNHLDNEAAERRGVNTWAYTHLQLPEMQHAIHIEERQLPAVAVIDSGFESDELNIVYGYDFADRDGDVSPSRGCLNADHGTMTSGIIAARNNGRLLNGVVPGAPLYVYKVQGAFSFLCLLGGASENSILAALEDVKTKDVVAVNMSLSVPDDSKLKNTIRDVIRTGKLIVNAADNSGENIDYKASIDGLVVVGGTQIAIVPAENGQSRIVEERWGNSNYWTIGGSWLAAPGHNVALITGGLSSGTSFSAPFVTGLGALLMGNGLTASRAYETMRSSADQIWVTYPDNSRALWHRINAYRAVCSVADCGEQQEERDAGREERDAGRNERDAESPERDAGRDGGVVGRDTGQEVSDAASDVGLPIPPNDLDAGIPDDIRPPEPAPNNYELYVKALPPPENVAQLFSLTTTPNCQFGPEDMVRLTDTNDGKRNLHLHRRGVLYFGQGNLTLLEHDGSLSQILPPQGGTVRHASSPLDDRIAFTVDGRYAVNLVEPGGEPVMVARTTMIAEPVWRPDGLELVVNQIESTNSSTNSFLFLPLRGAPESILYVPGRRMTQPIWSNNNALSYFCGGDDDNFHANNLCSFNRNELREEIVQRISDQTLSEPTRIFNLPGEVIAFTAGPLYVLEGGVVRELFRHPYTLGSNPFSPDGRLVVYYGRPEGVNVDGLYLFDRQTEQHCLLLGNATEAVWK